MISTLLHLLRLCPFLCGGARHVTLENVALRQQLAVYKRTASRPHCAGAIGSSGSGCPGCGLGGATPGMLGHVAVEYAPSMAQPMMQALGVVEEIRRGRS
jgi:hypothetical protein